MRRGVNDRLGHAGGDAALQRLAAVVRASLEAARIAETIRRAFHDLDESGVSVTISAGVASSPDDGADLETVRAEADAALYRAKAGGRNRVSGSHDAERGT